MIGEVIIYAGTDTPTGYLPCDGQTYNPSDIQYADLYSKIGTTYGGDGSTTFAVPDLRGRVAVGFGQGTGLSNRTLGQSNGVESVILDVTQMPAHNHAVNAVNAEGNANGPDNQFLSRGKFNRSTLLYEDSMYQSLSGSVTTVELNEGTVSAKGGGLPHNNMQPFTVLKYFIRYQ